MSKFKIWFEATRPKIFIASIVPVIIGNAAAYFHVNNTYLDDILEVSPTLGSIINQEYSLFIGIITLICAMGIQLTSNFFNDIYDFYKGADTKERKGPKRLVAEGIIPVQTMMKVTLGLVVFTFLLGLIIVDHRGWEILIVGVISLISAWAYTGGPYPLAYNSLGEVFVILFFGLVAVNGSFYVQTGMLMPDVLVISFIPGFLASNILNVNNIRDIETDQKVGKTTLASLIGRQEAIILFDVLLVVSYLSIILAAFMINSSFLYLPFISIPFAIMLSRDLHKLPDEKLNPVLIKSGIFMLIFGILVVLGYLLS